MQGIQIQTHDIHDSVTHRKIGTKNPFWTLDFGAPLNCTNLFFHETGQVDAVIAELTAIRAEMTGETDDTWRLTAKGEAALDGPGCDCMADAPEPVIRVELKAHVFTLRDPGGVLCNCGQLREHSVHVAPAPVKCLDKYDHLGSTDYCQRDEGHDGQHEGHMGRRWTPEPAPELKGAGRLAALIAGSTS